MWLLLIGLMAWAATPEQVLARVDEVAPLRALRTARPPAVARDVYVRAAGGEVVTGVVEVPGHSARKVWGVAVVDVPIGRYWAALNDDRSKVEYTKLEHVEVVSGVPCAAPRRVFQFAAIPLLTDRWWFVNIASNTTLRARSGGRVREQSWRSDTDWSTPTPTTTAWAAKGMHITSTEGAWFLVDIDGKSTLVEYYTWADIGGSVPSSLVGTLAAGGIDDTIRQYVALAKAGPTCAVD